MFFLFWKPVRNKFRSVEIFCILLILKLLLILSYLRNKNFCLSYTVSKTYQLPHQSKYVTEEWSRKYSPHKQQNSTLLTCIFFVLGNIRTYVRVYVCTYVDVYVCMYVRMYVCMYVCMYAYPTNVLHTNELILTKWDINMISPRQRHIWWQFRFLLSSGKLCRVVNKMQAVSISETSVNFFQTTRRNIQDDIHLLKHIFLIIIKHETSRYATCTVVVFVHHNREVLGSNKGLTEVVCSSWNQIVRIIC
jgi:hypothetical protein